MKYLKRINEMGEMISHDDRQQKASEKVDNTLNNSPKLKELKEFGLKYTVKSIKNLLGSKWDKENSKMVTNRWDREHFPFPPELDIINVLFHSKLAEFYFKGAIRKRGVEVNPYDDWVSKIKKVDIDNFPLPESVFKPVIEFLKAVERGDIEIDMGE